MQILGWKLDQGIRELRLRLQVLKLVSASLAQSSKD